MQITKEDAERYIADLADLSRRRAYGTLQGDNVDTLLALARAGAAVMFPGEGETDPENKVVLAYARERPSDPLHLMLASQFAPGRWCVALNDGGQLAQNRDGELIEVTVNLWAPLSAAIAAMKP